jgi:putative NADPH-quinone reductase
MKLGIQRLLVLYAHPSHRGLNGAILDAFLEGIGEAGIEHRLRDLNAIGFKAVLDEAEWVDGFAGKVPPDCLAEQEQVLWADAMAWIFPAWNFSLPAILKGYLDRAFLIPGFAFDSDPDGVVYRGGLLKHKKALIIQTLGGSLQTGYRFGNVSDYCQAAVSSLHYAGIRNTHVAQFWNLYKETAKDSPEVLRILELVRGLGREFDRETVAGVQAVVSPV